MTTVERAVELLVDQVKAEQSRTSWNTYVWLGRVMVEYWGADRQVTSITQPDVQAMVNHFRHKVKPSTIRHQVSFVNRMFAAVSEALGVRLESPARGIRKPKVNNKRVRCMSAEEEMKLRQVMTWPAWSVAEFAYQTGLRRLEQWRLKPEHIQLWRHSTQKNPITGREVPLMLGLANVVTSKTEEARQVPLNFQAAAIACSWMRRGKAYLFAPDKEDRFVSATRFTQHVWRPAIKKAGISDLRWHDLRHTFATRALRGGARPEQISKVMGHKSLEQTDRYMHWCVDQLWPAAMAAGSPQAREPQQMFMGVPLMLVA